MTAASAFITARKGFCYLTIKHRKRNFEMMRIRNYKIDAEEKRHMRRLYPDVIFDWKKITAQLAVKREDCRSYRSRRQTSGASRRARSGESFYGVYQPGTRTIYASGVPSTASGVVALLDAVLRLDHMSQDEPSPWPPALRRQRRDEP